MAAPQHQLLVDNVSHGAYSKKNKQGGTGKKNMKPSKREQGRRTKKQARGNGEEEQGRTGKKTKASKKEEQGAKKNRELSLRLPLKQ